MIVDFILNGEDVSVQTRPLERLSDILKDRFGLASLMNDCRSGTCGKCVVFFNGRLVNACLLPAFKARASEIISYEGFMSTENYASVMQAFTKAGADLCGFCNAAFYMAAGSLLEYAERPSDSVIMETMSSVYCRCVTPSLVLKAATLAVEIRMGGKYNRAR